MPEGSLLLSLSANKACARVGSVDVRAEGRALGVGPGAGFRGFPGKPRSPPQTKSLWVPAVALGTARRRGVCTSVCRAEVCARGGSGRRSCRQQG